MVADRTGVAALVAACVFGAVALQASIPARAQESTESARVYVTDLTLMAGPGAAAEGAPSWPEDLHIRALVENSGQEPLSDLRLEVEVFGPARSRSVLQLSLDEGNPRSYLNLVRSARVDIRAAAALAPGDVAGAELTITGRELGWVPATDSRRGVYPVRISVAQGTAVLDSVTTATIFLSEQVTAPLTTVMVWPLDAVPWRQPGGGYSEGADVEILPGGRLDRLVAALETNPLAPVTLAPAPHVLEDLLDRATGFAVNGRQVEAAQPAPVRAGEFLERIEALSTRLSTAPLAGAYADADLAGLVAAGLDGEAVTTVTQGRLRLEAALDTRPIAGAFYLPHGPLSQDVIALLAAAGINTVVASETLLEAVAPGPETTATVRTVAGSGGEEMTVLAADAAIQAALTGSAFEHGPVPPARRILAEAALIFTESPFKQGRSLVILPPPLWSPSPRGAGRLLAELAAAPWIGLATTDAIDLTSEIDSGPADPEQPLNQMSGIAQARAALAALRGSIDGPPGGRSLDLIEDDMLRATSAWWRGPLEARGQSMVASAQAEIDEVFGTIDVPSSARITLTSETGTIPITVVRTVGGPIRVRVTLESPRLEWPSGQSQEVALAMGGAQTLAFDVDALATGTVPVEVSVTDPSGAVLLTSTRLPVRSTAISRPALIGIVTLVALLLLVGLRRRRPKLEVVGERLTKGQDHDPPR